MESRLRARSLAAVVGGVLTLLFHANAHVYQEVPLSRQYSWSREFHNSTFENVENAPFAYNAGGVQRVIERSKNLTDPDVLEEHGGGDLFPLYFVERAENGNFLESNEIAKRHGVCGDPRLGSTSENLTYSTPNADWPVIDVYESGQVIEMNVVVIFYHWGHFEFFVCDTSDLDDPDGVVTQECLNKYPLTRAADDGNASRIDPNYTGRYYTDPACRMNETEQSFSTNVRDTQYSIKMRYVLPDIECDHCVLQMHYLTGGRCSHVGYDEFDPPSWNSTCANSTEDWIDSDVWMCGVGNGYAEEFWGCSDIAIVRPASQAPSHSPTQAPTAQHVVEDSPVGASSNESPRNLAPSADADADDDPDAGDDDDADDDAEDDADDDSDPDDDPDDDSDADDGDREEGVAASLDSGSPRRISRFTDILLATVAIAITQIVLWRCS